MLYGATGYTGGLIAARMLAAELAGIDIEPPPPETALGGLMRHLRDSKPATFQPSNINWGLMSVPAEIAAIRDRRERREKHAVIAVKPDVVAAVLPGAAFVAAGEKPVAEAGSTEKDVWIEIDGDGWLHLADPIAVVANVPESDAPVFAGAEQREFVSILAAVTTGEDASVDPPSDDEVLVALAKTLPLGLPWPGRASCWSFRDEQ